MSFVEDFCNMNLTTDKNNLIDVFIKAIYEIRAEELNIDINELVKNNDQVSFKLIKKLSVQEICTHSDNVKITEDVPKHAKKLIENYEETNSITVFRGTRLPISEGSFDNGYIHTTPHIATSVAYAVGISNSFGGIGRLLTKDEEKTGLGFIHAFDAEFSTKIYKNFQFEQFYKNEGKDSDVTINDFVKELKEFSYMESDSFSIEYSSEKNLYGNPKNPIKMSNNMKKWYEFITSRNCMTTKYYEVMLPNDTKAKHTFLMLPNSNIIELNLNNAKTKKVLNKIQDLLIRDFYEIVPLEKLTNNIEMNISSCNLKEPLELKELIEIESKKLKELKESVVKFTEELKVKSLFSDNELKNMMNSSKMVGSTNMIGEPTKESKVKYHILIENFMKEINLKKEVIEEPVNTYLNSIKIDQTKNVDEIDNILNKIKEKIPLDSKIDKVDDSGFIKEFIEELSAKKIIRENDCLTINDLSLALNDLKTNHLKRDYVGKKPLTNIYKPMIDFIFYEKINKYDNFSKTKKEVINTIKELKNDSQKNISKKLSI